MKLFTITLFFTVSVLAGNTPAEDKKIIDKYIHSLIEVETDQLDEKVTSRFIDGKVYSTKIIRKLNGGTSSNSGPSIIVSNGKALAIEKNSSTTELKDLMNSFKKGVNLSKEVNVLYFEKLLDALYPISDSFGGKDKKVKETITKKNQIIFIRGKFFKDFKAIVVKLDNSGKIIKIDYTLKYKK